MAEKHRIIVAVTGATGSIYAKVLFDKLILLQDQIDDVGVIFSHNARDVWRYEQGNTDYEKIPFRIYAHDNFYTPFSSGSNSYKTMLVCPCTMGTLGRIATGVSNDLITRSADVILKERRRLILLARETPLSLIHINNMKTVTEAGGIIFPACPSFYNKPATFEDMAGNIINRVLDMSGFNVEMFRWSGKLID
ncbi:MAG: UbiX family flavin prenyltransferase [Bacteroidota bacterium]